MEKLRWVFELWDKISAPAKEAQSSLSGLLKEAGFASASFADLTKYVTLAGTALLTATGAGAYAFAKMGVDAMSFKENTLTSFKLMLGSQEAADRVFNQAVQMAKRTPWETTDVVSGFKSLLSAGFKEEDVGTVFSALSDVAAASGFDKAVINSLSVQMAQVKAYGKLQMVDLRVMANQMAQAGVGIGAVYEKIAKNMGIGTEQVKDAMGKGEIDADVGIFSILQAIQEHASGGDKLGTLTKNMGDTISGLFSTIKSSGSDLFLTLEKRMEDMPGMMAFKGALMNLRDLLDTNTESGKRFQTILTGLFDSDMAALFGQFAGPEGMGKMATMLNTIMNLALAAWDIFKAFAGGIWDAVAPMVALFSTMEDGGLMMDGIITAFRYAGLFIGFFINGVVTLVGVFGLLIKTLEFILKLIGYFVWAVAEGLSLGLFGSDLFDGGQLVKSFKEDLGISSPSKKFMEIGDYSAQGFQVGFDKRGADFDMSSVVAPTGAVDGATSSTPSVQVQLTVQVDNTGHADGDAIAQRLGELLPAQLASVFDQLATEMGVG